MKRRKLRRFLAVASMVAAVSGLGVAPAAAHGQKVHPPAKDVPVVEGPISQQWAQAHCNAQAPEVTGGASNGVVVFSPEEALPCLDVWENPGGQVHPHAVPES